RDRRDDADAEELLSRQQAGFQSGHQGGAGNRAALSDLSRGPGPGAGERAMSVQPAKSAPERVVLEGRYVRLEPVAPRRAADHLAFSPGEEAEAGYGFRPNDPPMSVDAVDSWIAAVQDGPDRYVAVIDKASGRAVGRQAWLRIRPEHGSVEIGAIYWGLPMARSPLATEALFRFARHAFDELGYRRFEWKCNDRNAP